MLNFFQNMDEPIVKDIVALLFIITIRGILPLSASSTVYVTLDSYGDENKAQFLQWSSIQHNISSYVKSQAKVCFLPGEYQLDQQVVISNVNNLMIIGMSSVTFKCADNVAIFINASITVRIQNFKFVNCGIKKSPPFNYKGLYKISATVSLLNVYSVVLSNITFENSFGHGIVGINVLGSSTLVNITVYHNNNLSGNSLTPIGGIILVYVDTIDDIHHNQTQSQNHVLIKTVQYVA